MKGNFQIIVLIFFIFVALFGLLVFSGTIKLGSQKNKAGSLGTVTLWGTANFQSVAGILEDFNNINETFSIKYVQKNPETFSQDLLEALASGLGPDLFFIPDNLVFDYANKIFTIPYDSYSAASFKNTFSSAGEVFLTSKGIIAFPISIDPLMMYYNRSILEANSVVYPPVYWDDLVNLVSTLTQKDELNKIVKSTVALGHFANISHAKDIIVAMFIQAGNLIVSEQDGYFNSTLNQTFGNNVNLNSILDFYTSFANPLKTTYSWNRSFPKSIDAFSAGDLAFYFGYASELPILLNKNPNLNFAVAPFPQIKNSSFKATSARVTGIAVSNFSKNLNTALMAANLLSTTDFADKFNKLNQTPPARRDLLANKLSDSFYPFFYSSALYARSWLDPSHKNTDIIFQGMVEGILSNTFSIDNAIKDANAKLSLLLAKYR
jgi:ABC-type glycerol-3-phosphate transport system substrate-binding protein